MNENIASFYVGTKIVFGKDASLQVGEELLRYKANKAMIVTDKGIINAGLLDRIVKAISDSGIEYIVFDEVPPNPPSAIVNKGVSLFKENQCNALVAVGGGSSIDASKAISVVVENGGNINDYDNSSQGGQEIHREGPPVFTIPTTSGTGSEVTQWAVITDEKRNWKSSIGSPLMAPKVALVDPMLTLGLPPAITAATGVDALTHAIEAYTCKGATTGDSPITDALALRAIELIGNNLRTAYAQGENYEARKNTMIGSTLAGMAFPQIGLGTVHGMAHPLGGHFDVAHGVANAILLPYVMEFNLLTCPDRFATIAVALGENIEGLSPMEAARKAVTAVRSLVADVEIPRLNSFEKVDPNQFKRLAEDALEEAATHDNPKKTTVEDALNLYNKAYRGE